MEKNESDFIIELAKIMEVDGKININKYTAILTLVSKHFDLKTGRNYTEPTEEEKELIEVVWGEPLRDKNIPGRNKFNSMTSAMQELIEYVNLLEVRIGRSSYEIKLILDYADKMLEKELILEKTLVKKAVIKTMETCDELTDISLNKYIENIFNGVDYREIVAVKNPESLGGEAPAATTK